MKWYETAIVFLLIGHGTGNAYSFYKGLEFPYSFYVLFPIFVGIGFGIIFHQLSHNRNLTGNLGDFPKSKS